MKKYFAVTISLFTSLVAFSASAEPPPSAKALVFVPGILGSKLLVDGAYVWGAEAWDRPGLAYDAGQNVTTEAMDEASVRIVLADF